MARSDPQTNVRLPQVLKDWLCQQAEANRRTVSAELIVCLEEAQRQRQQKQEATHAT